MTCMSETWTELASSSTGRSSATRARRARVALRTMRVSVQRFWKKQEWLRLRAGDPHWVPLILMCSQRGMLLGYDDIIRSPPPSPLIFWNQRDSGGLGLKSLRNKELQGKSWKQTGCGWEKAFCQMSYIVVILYSCSEVKGIAAKKRSAVPKRET